MLWCREPQWPASAAGWSASAGFAPLLQELLCLLCSICTDLYFICRTAQSVSHNDAEEMDFYIFDTLHPVIIQL